MKKKLLQVKVVSFSVFVFFSLSFSLFAAEFTSNFGQKFIKINPGEFIMGTEDFDLLAKEVHPELLEYKKKELPPHKVTISKEFYLATTEVTQSQWEEFMGYRPGKENRWQRKDWKNLPVSRVNWEEIQEFIEVINDLDDNYRYRLPTEAEWEYSARAGTRGLRPFNTEDMDQFAWYITNSDNKPMPVGTLKPNAWGLYDMLGNVWEWISDSYDPEYYSVSPSIDPSGAELSSRKSIRGGSYHCTPERVRAGIRGSFLSNRSLSVLGFRLAANKK